jgi:hypothetical protein
MPANLLRRRLSRQVGRCHVLGCDLLCCLISFLCGAGAHFWPILAPNGCSLKSCDL